MDKKSRQTAKQKLICSFTAVWMALAAAGITTAGFANSIPLRSPTDPCLSAFTYDTADTADTTDKTEKESIYAPDSPDLPKQSDTVSIKVIDTDEKKDTSDSAEKTSSEKTTSKASSETSSENTTSKAGSETSSEKTSSKASSETTSGKTSSENKKSDPDTDEKKKDDKQKTKQPPKEYLIDVAHINQNSNLVTGCEIVSAKMVLDYYGKKDITFDNMLKHTEMWNLKTTKDGKLYGKTPYEAFIGNPKVYSGFGCFPPVIESMVDDFEFDDLYAEDTCGLPLDFLAKTYVTQDTPVLVWATIGMGESYPTYTWYGVGHKGEPNDKKYTWRAGEHCLVLVGYDDKYYSFADPLSYQKVTKYEKKLVEKRYKEIGMQSMLIRKKETE